MKKNYEELKKQALEMLNNDDDLFCEVIDELTNCSGYAGDDRCYPMYELDDLFCDYSLRDFLGIICEGSFDLDAEYFVDTIFGLQTVDDKAEHYHNNFDTEDVLDAAIEDYPRLWVMDEDFEAILKQIVEEQ